MLPSQKDDMCSYRSAQRGQTYSQCAEQQQPQELAYGYVGGGGGRIEGED